jgi:hypothetical protein
MTAPTTVTRNSTVAVRLAIQCMLELLLFFFSLIMICFLFKNQASLCLFRSLRKGFVLHHFHNQRDTLFLMELYYLKILSLFKSLDLFYGPYLDFTRASDVQERVSFEKPL